MSTILITGANRGLGLQFVRQHAADGSEVLATSRQPEKSDDLKQLASQHSKVVLHRLDVTDAESVKDLADKLNGKPIDVLCTARHLSSRRPAYERNRLRRLAQGHGDQSFRVLRVTEALLENVAASPRKQIAAISTSLSSLRGVQGGSVAQAGTSYQYRSSKTALNMALSILAKELEPRGISVVLLDPGWVKTDRGGPQAPLSPKESIAGMRKVLAGNSMEISGKFLGHDGMPRPW